LSNVYLVRHGQAGTREAYDSLSELGLKQARLLGEYFVSQRIEFAVVYSGSLNRQQQTAAGISEAYAQSGQSFPQITVDDQWNEFDLTGIYKEIGPKLCEVDAVFRSEYEEMRREVRENAGVVDATVHRQWRPCDTKMVEAWIAGKFSYSGESWPQFRERVSSRVAKLNEVPRQANVLVSTSATPTGVMTDLALGLDGTEVRRLAGVLFNSSYSMLRERDGSWQLFQYNAVPHLTAAELRTHR
jgi:broad specificity phosphatase PhoE